MEKKILVPLVGILCLFFATVQAAFAREYPVFAAQPYDSLAGPDAPGIPNGTSITRDNWTQYRQYLTFGMQQLYGGQFFYHIPPGVATLVGPTISIPRPWKYARDTEQYGSQTKLVPLPTGSLDIANYVAGVPFPNPSGSNKGMEILYNVYYQYSPFAIHNRYGVITADKFNNNTGVLSDVINMRMNHISEEGMGIELPGRPTVVFQTIYDQVLAPEQSKYTALLDVQPDDVKKLSELYVFLPSLRRSLRLSAAARCAPTLGTDYTNDDNNGFSGIPTWFKATYLGEKKILGMVHEHQGPSREDPASWESVGTDGFHIFWPRPVAGFWELRKVDIIDLTPLDTVPQARGYCYGHKVLYIDQETNLILSADIFDRENKIYKLQIIVYSPSPTGDSHGSVYVGPVDGAGVIFDLQNSHMGHPYQQMKVEFNNQVPANMRDIQRYGTPAGLDQVMQ